MRLIHDDQSYIFDKMLVVLKSVVQGFHHGDVTIAIFLILNGFNPGIDDFVRYTNRQKLMGSLYRKFDAVRKNEDPFFPFFHEVFGNGRENDRFSTSCGKLIE